MTPPDRQVQGRLQKYVSEAVIGLVLAALIVLAFVASVSSVPFIYQGF